MIRNYRGKRKDNGGWAYGDLYSQYGTRHFIIVRNLDPPADLCTSLSHIRGDFKEVHPKTVGQQVGLKAAKSYRKGENGKEIYEGDVLLNDIDAETMSGQKFVVKYLPGHFVAGGILGAGDHIGEDCQIIGNVHDNPELLEQA